MLGSLLLKLHMEVLDVRLICCPKGAMNSHNNFVSTPSTTSNFRSKFLMENSGDFLYFQMAS